MTYTLEKVKEIYLEKRKKFGDNAYLHISEIFRDIEAEYKNEYIKSGKGIGNAQQSWNAWKGKNFERLIKFVVENEIAFIGLRAIRGDTLERKKRLTYEEDLLRRNVGIRLGEGNYVPDCDLILYDPNTLNVVAIVSCKTSLRERVAQSGYWSLKLKESEVTNSIRAYFVTADEDGTLVHTRPMKKGRAICETDLDGTYVLRNIEESEKVKRFKCLTDDLRRVYNKNRPSKRSSLRKSKGSL